MHYIYNNKVIFIVLKWKKHKHHQEHCRTLSLAKFTMSESIGLIQASNKIFILWWNKMNAKMLGFACVCALSDGFFTTVGERMFLRLIFLSSNIYLPWHLPNIDSFISIQSSLFLTCILIIDADISICHSFQYCSHGFNCCFSLL